jgi:hypothetical protein
MTGWEQRIINAFVSRYPSSAAAREDEGAVHRPLRIQAKRIFADFDRAPPDEKESFLEAAESLEANSILSLVWARRRKPELVSAFVCGDPEKLFAFAGLGFPKTVAAAAREAASTAAGENPQDAPPIPLAPPSIPFALFTFLAKDLNALDAERGINARAIRDLALLCSAFLPGHFPQEGAGSSVAQGETAKPTGMTVRALSVSLYHDSKRLETLLDLFGPVFNRARRRNIPVPDFSFLDRSFPETLIAGKILLDIPGAPLVNASGAMLGLPLGTVLKIRKIRTLHETDRGAANAAPMAGTAAPSVLSIENKETFYALAGRQSGAFLQDGERAFPPEALAPDYDCLIYTGGHPNRAVAALVSVLAESGFVFYHAGDLDPDGILIMQELAKIARRSITPVGMDQRIFDQYLYCGRRLDSSMLRRTLLIHDSTRSVPGIGELINRIEETGMGIEQEIIDYYNININLTNSSNG